MADWQESYDRIHERGPISGGPARQKWDEAVAAEMESGRHKRKAEAAIAANRKHPGLRERMLAETNG